MLTGKRLFADETVSDILAAVLRQELAPPQLPAAAPLRLRRLLERCLDRDVRLRLRDIGEARVELARLQDAPPDAPAKTSVIMERAAKPKLLRLGGALASAVVVAAFGWWLGHRSVPSDQLWSSFTQLTDASGVETGPSLSPDGASFAYSSASRGNWDIYVQRVGGRNPVLVAGDPDRNEVWPAFSPDGQRIAFNQGGGKGGIFVVGATGESVRRLTDFGSNPAWSPDGQHIVFSTDEVGSVYARTSDSELWTVDPSGGAPVKIEDGDAVQPAWSPSGKRIAFWRSRNGQRDVATIPAGGGPQVPRHLGCCGRLGARVVARRAVGLFRERPGRIDGHLADRNRRRVRPPHDRAETRRGRRRRVHGSAEAYRPTGRRSSSAR